MDLYKKRNTSYLNRRSNRSTISMANEIKHGNYYRQNVVNESLENTFELEPMNNNQLESKGPGRGGKRPGAGRRKGSTNKITAEEFFTTYKKVTKGEYLEDLVKRLQQTYEHVDSAVTRKEFDDAINNAHKYDSFIAKYLFTDVKEVDVTSNGETIGASFTFPTRELNDWRDA